MKIANWATKIKNNYLFQTVSDKLEKFREKNPEKKIINMGIGDVSLPIADKVIRACVSASNEMGKISSFRGYSPNGGYDFLKQKIKYEYKNLGILIDTDEIFISDGAKSDMSNILDIFSHENTCLIPDPVYPVYLDTSIMNDMKIEFADATEQNNFLPEPDFNSSKKIDIIYICSPNNPTGAAYTKTQIKKWVDYANSCGAVILYDAAYEVFIEDNNHCRSIFEIPESKTCAIEFKSFSKSAGFTGMRCGYSIVPKNLKRESISLNYLWNRRHSTKFNGVSYIIQRAAEASLSDEGKLECQKSIKYYKQNSKLISEILDKLSIKFFGGLNSPYIWLKCPNSMKSWEFFDYLLQNLNIVGTPGSGFGKNGENYFRLSCFASREDTQEACSRLKKINI
ncbi:MAG: LL-diaminopimelate aminotransferase [Clostridia bacterium]|nr:LL-diaminopimelate aminotransferase [Clostridia bacterium]